MSVIIQNQKLDQIATWMKPVKETNLPDVLKGVFFMDGNPLPDDCITMYNLDWNIETNSLVLPVFAPLQWTFHQTISGSILLNLVRIIQFKYKIEFSDAHLKNGQITPFIFGIKVPKYIINATIYRDENSQGEIWQRKNLWFGGFFRLGEYVLRRIVDENGNYTPAFHQMLNQVNNDCLVIVDDQGNTSA
ncbi:MAG: hypothetical protein F6K61_00645 [Sphaerospermopsis sp. SIO1G1]|nr:hypothetical protein [Sphaerospermopsis sp. SIO1G1]